MGLRSGTEGVSGVLEEGRGEAHALGREPLGVYCHHLLFGLRVEGLGLRVWDFGFRG